MKTNVGKFDRILRAALGLALLWLAFGSGYTVMDGAVLKYIAAAVGLVMLAVAAIGTCPIYSVLGIRTCKT